MPVLCPHRPELKQHPSLCPKLSPLSWVWCPVTREWALLWKCQDESQNLGKALPCHPPPVPLPRNVAFLRVKAGSAAGMGVLCYLSFTAASATTEVVQ